jgi:phosphoribosylglycinamide formyltransferase 1
MKRIVILISGRGSNMQALVEACARERWNARVVAVLSNRPGAAGLQFASEQGVENEAVDHTRFADRAAFDTELAARIDSFAPDLLLLAGFMRILSDGFVQRYQGRMLNVHPSLLPSFTGLHTHQRALDAGCKLAGATVHFVTPTLDHGPIVIQAAVPVLPDDIASTLAARVLQREHVIYPRAVRWWVDGALRIEHGRVMQRDNEAQWLL